MDNVEENEDDAANNVAEMVHDLFPSSYNPSVWIDEKDVLRFGSCRKEYLLSNFCELDAPIDMRGLKWNTSEAAFQGLWNLEPRDAARLAVGGDLSTLAALDLIVPEESEKKKKFWGRRLNGKPAMLGIVPKMALGKAASKLGITKRERPSFCKGPEGRRSFKKMCDLFMCILRAKYAANPLSKQALLATGDKFLLEHSRFSGARTKNSSPPLWNGFYKDGKILGMNLMGLMHMKLRKELQDASKKIH